LTFGPDVLHSEAKKFTAFISGICLHSAVVKLPKSQQMFKHLHSNNTDIWRHFFSICFNIRLFTWPVCL
jgi:hypothetical protein